jgi:hypothetical protein
LWKTCFLRTFDGELVMKKNIWKHQFLLMKHYGEKKLVFVFLLFVFFVLLV